MNKTLLTAAVAGILAVGFSAQADDAAGKCYGIAKAGQNSCANANGIHSCKGQAKVDNDGGDFVLVSAADCEKAGGSSTPKKQ